MMELIYVLSGMLVGWLVTYSYFKDMVRDKVFVALDNIRLAVEDSSAAARDMAASYERVFEKAFEPKEFYGAYFWIGRVKTAKGLSITIQPKKPEKDTDADGNPWNLVREVLPPIPFPPEVKP